MNKLKSKQFQGALVLVKAPKSVCFTLQKLNGTDY